MRVLLVVHGFPPAARGGTELYAEAHARTLARQHGDEVFVLTRECDPARDEYALRTETADRIRVIRINNTYRRTRSFAETYANEAIGRLADAIVDDLRPSVAHIHHLTGLSTTIVDSLAKRQVPTWMTLHDYWLICHRGQLFDIHGNVCDGHGGGMCDDCVGLAGATGAAGFAGAAVVRTLERVLPSSAAAAIRATAQSAAGAAASHRVAVDQAALRAAHMRAVCSAITQFVAPSQSIRDRFVRFGVPAERIALSGYGVDHSAFAHVAAVPRRSRALRVGFLGSLMISKAPHLLLAAADLLPAGSVALHFYGDICGYHGDDTYRTVIEAHRRADAEFHGPIAHDRVPEALASLDVVVVPSVWPENSPFVVHEALLAGVPVVASAIGGIPELVVHERNGLLFEAGNAAALARALDRLANEEGLLDRLRSGIEPGRTIEDDVRALRERYTAPPANRTRLAAIVLNYRTPDQTFLAVKALRASDRPIDDLIVVNNGAPDSELALRLTGEPRVALIHTGRNLGFSGGMNAGIAAALERGADRILLVNSDVIVPPDCIAALEAALDGIPDAGIAGPAMLARTDPQRVASLGIGYSTATGRMRHHGYGKETAGVDLTAVRTVDAVSGCVMLIRRQVLETAGRLDDAYFYSFEDVDFCLRARRAGFRTVVVGRARVFHEGNRSIGHATPARLYFAARNHLLLVRSSDRSAAPIVVARQAGVVALNVAHALRARGGTLAARLAAVYRGIRDYASGRFGAGAEAGRLT